MIIIYINFYKNTEKIRLHVHYTQATFSKENVNKDILIELSRRDCNIK